MRNSNQETGLTSEATIIQEQRDERDAVRRLSRATHVITDDGLIFRWLEETGHWYTLDKGPLQAEFAVYDSYAELKEAHPTARVWITQEDALRRWPRIVAHLICESLGYFTPSAAALAVACHANDKPMFCEYYSHCGGGKKYRELAAQAGYEAALLEVGRDRLIRTTTDRHGHRGYMSNYSLALALVKQMAETGREPLFAAWF